MIFEYLSLYIYIYINHGDVAIIWDIQISTGDILGIYIYILVGGLEHEWIMTFHSVGNVIIPSDEVRTPSFFRGVGLPPTSI